MDEFDIVRLARRQHGLATRRQVLAAGLTDDQIDLRVRRGRWERLRRGVYVIGAAERTWEQRVMAACLAGGAGVVASHRTAARLWGLVERSGKVEVLAGQRQVRLDGVVGHRSLLLPAVDITMRDDIPVTSVARTIADISVGHSEQTVGTWVDESLRARHLQLLELSSCVARLAGPGRADMATLRDVLDRRLPGYDPGDSELESRALLALADAGLPAPVQQHRVRLQDGRRVRIDLAYPELRLAIELDGWEHHGRRVAFDRDRERANLLVLLGWRVFRFTSTTSDATLVDTVRQAIESASARAAGQ